MSEAFLCDAVRTPFGRYGGALSAVRADELGAAPIKALLARNPSNDGPVLDDGILGCANQAGEDNRNVARMAVLHWDILSAPAALDSSRPRCTS
jgi:acetyl-CoA acetyltransferase